MDKPIGAYSEQEILQEALTQAAVSPREVFCLAWPTMLVGLEALRALVPIVPSIGWAASLAIGVVIALGKRVSDILGCNTAGIPIVEPQDSVHQEPR
jgi:hypothetical protein